MDEYRMKGVKSSMKIKFPTRGTFRFFNPIVEKDEDHNEKLKYD